MSGDSNEYPSWYPVPDEDVSPEPQQRTIINSTAYPMRVLAGAGTGKTFTMVRKIEHLIDEEGVSPDRILALTFTNNAADSMREKLNAKLGAAGYDIDAYTYHSIANEILSEYAYEAGIDPDFEVATDPEKYAIVLDVLDDIEYRSVKPNVYGNDGYASGAASKLLNFISSMKRSGITPADIDAFLGPAERVYELADLPERIEEIASDHLGGRSVSSVLDSLPDARAAVVAERDALGTHGIEASARDFLDRIVDLCDALEVAFEAHEAGKRELPDNAYKLPKYLLGGYASGAPKGIPDDLDLELTDHLESFISDSLTARDLTAGYAAYERELAARNLIDFDGLVVKAAALMDSPVGEEIADQWDYVFCDEFQDTDRLQFDLVTALVTDDNLFVVGDDDQAIYEWRGAHVANITDELDQAFAALTDEPLEENFRSRQPILDLANEAIQKLDHRHRHKTLRRVDEPDYDGDTVATVELPDDEADADGPGQLRTVVQNLLSGTAEHLDTAYDPGDIAVLVRKNDHATPVIEEFEDAGIPYQVAGDLATESVGVGTVTAYLKALARSEDEVSWNRILQMRYRLCDADLRTLNGGEQPLVDTLLETPLDEFEEPDRVAAAREHVTELLDIRDSASLSHLYRKLTDITNIEWYLSEQERRDLAQLENVIEQYGDSAIQPPLTPEFIDSLEHYDSLFDESGSTPSSQPDVADDAVNVMTIHKSKGLDFPVVIVPQVTADEWAPSSRAYDGFETSLSDGPEAAFAEDFVERDAHETRRVFHVAITRAEDVLVLQGGSEDDDDSADVHPVSETVDEILPATIPWQPERGHLPLWTDVEESLPDAAIDWTDSLASETVEQIGGTVNHDGEELGVKTARDRVIDLATATLNGELSPSDDRETLQVPSLTGPSAPSPPLVHSYTSLAAYEDCPRKHYLEYVVNAFPDYQEVPSEIGGGVSQREIGLLFHDTAEQAANQNVLDREEWYEIAERLASQRRAKDALSAAKQAIDRYFELDISEYEIIDAERRFEIELGEHTLTGYIDAVYRTPDDELIVIDYKATERYRDLDDDKQLPIYLLACRDLYDAPVNQAGYAYVGDIGPKVESRGFSDPELTTVESEVTSMMNEISELSFRRFSSGDHCQWCDHNHLDCAPASLLGGSEFES
ncbi:ATP-dependent exoDNAse (exonuclease V) beta subunit (contains helicase and exonuclease domains) [Halanaeroarchaeum sp. HSR-CO]|uniref:ATP-dependent helicase n=1 Tax=Halanaeroarchaeum sp. HSR-CO TaxID=2866382 RepID=UPI00217D7692|nr:ATP-dependent DNA helicase [Halanaeroarchaeum sp. HSR-CO]UWG47832.1 ATP-dependent exoDNAse (exonuclease V) beta subunit (contains helicase and exonuclease domains) [Halanaeroarchaeum sp. HSR-CO]